MLQAGSYGQCLSDRGVFADAQTHGQLKYELTVVTTGVLVVLAYYQTLTFVDCAACEC